MRNLILILFLGLASLTASAQGHVYRGPYIHRPPVYIGVNSFAPFYPYYGFYAPWYYPNYNYTRPSKLEMKIEDIKSDYKDRIWSARHDSNLSHQQRKKEIHRLKTERDQAIADLKANYYKNPAR